MTDTLHPGTALGAETSPPSPLRDGGGGGPATRRAMPAGDAPAAMLAPPPPSRRGAGGEAPAAATSASYDRTRERLADYFDRTAAETWARLTSDAPVSRIRATVRAGRARMQATLASWLPEDLAGARVLDAGCGTGTLAIELARRGAHVTAIDIAGSLVALAGERAAAALPAEAAARIDWRAGDMLSPGLGRFDHVIAMDSLIHYPAGDMADAIAQLAGRTSTSLAVTFAPRTPLLATMHLSGKLFPRSDRSPAIIPVTGRRLTRLLAERGPATGRQERVSAGFYISEALEVLP